MARTTGRSVARTASPRANEAAQRRAAAEEEQRRQEEAAQRGDETDRASAGHLPADAGGAGEGEAPKFAQLVDAVTGLALLIDPAAVAHIGPSIGSQLHTDPAKAAKGEHMMGPVTQVSTIGGVVVNVLEDVEEVAAILGV